MISGATPAGVEAGNEVEVSRNIRRMFGEVAPRYDLLNRLLSLRVDQYWRGVVVRRMRPQLDQADVRVLDLCCGTGDLLIELEMERRRLRGVSGFTGIGADFSRPMLYAAEEKLRRHGLTSRLTEADALRLPLPDGGIDLITIGFGFRNLANYRSGMAEMFRLLRPGGRLALLEFSQPATPLIGPLFGFYFRNVLPRLGNAISGAGAAYSYLQKSVERFLSPAELAEGLKAAGFSQVEVVSLTGGIATLHLAVK